MGYGETWKVLEEILIELRKKGHPAPENVMNDLKSAKTLIRLLDTGEGRGEIGQKVELYLANVEASLVTEAQKIFPSERIDEWLRRLEASSCNICMAESKGVTKAESRFIPGLPRDQKWVRVTPIAALPQETLEQLAAESGLSFKKEQDGHLIVFGNAEGIRDFVKKMTAYASK